MAKLLNRNHFSGQKNSTEGSGRDGYRLDDILRDNTLDVADLWTVVQALADKLDLDAGVTDTDYRATVDAVHAPATVPRTEIVPA